jgi:23S rRNA (guanosine2251-2'-O)-methyltransferase
VIIYGFNPVLEALRSGRVQEVHFESHGGTRMKQLLDLATERGVRVKHVSTGVLDRESERGVHQGVTAKITAIDNYTVSDLLRVAQTPALIVVLDNIEDPHNVGAILRTAEAVGADGIIIQRRRSASLAGVASKASAGAMSHLRIATVVNIARAIEELKTAGVWTVGLASEASSPYNLVDWSLPSAIVVGAEGHGLRRLVRSRCDRLAAIPMRGHINSLNVSVAAGIALFEVVRQRSLGQTSSR